MKVLIISIDKGLLGQGQLGDVVERHRKYGEFCDRLDIIVLAKKGFKEYKISNKVTAYPTNSYFKLRYGCNAYKIGKELFKSNKYDLIITQTPFIDGLVGLRLKKKFKIKLLVHFHGDFWSNKNWLKENKINYLLLPLSKFVAKRADAIRVMSEGQYQKIKDFFSPPFQGGVGGGLPMIRVISTPIDLSKFMEHGTWNMEQKNVLHIGRDDEVKDYNTLVKAFKIVKNKFNDTKFVQAGADRTIKKAMADNDFYDIENKGQLSYSELINLYAQSDVFVLSSASESFGKVLVEANAAGKPVVSTATTGAKEIIEDGKNGFLVPIGDAQKLAEKIIWLLENPDEARKMGEYGRELVKEKFDNNTEKIVKFWNDIINNNL